MQKSNFQALKLLILPLILGGIFFTSLESTWPVYIIGQIAGALFLTQCFILMHEFGHNSFFKSTKMNRFSGHLISQFTFIPFYNWYKIHHLHHEWTGWRDKDPTTENTFADQLSPIQVKIVNFCWKYWIPIFSMGYRFGIYWKKDKLKRFLNEYEFRKSMQNLYLLAILYLLVLIVAFDFALSILPAIYLSWMMTDIIMLSQHAHIEMNNSKGENVSPIKYIHQPPFTRSLILPRSIAKYLFFNFNMHESHHAYPGLPCYHLSRTEVKKYNSYPLLSWLRKVKKMHGVDYIFKSSPDRKDF